MGRRLLAGDDLTLAHHYQAAIQSLLDLYTGMGVAKPSPLRDELKGMPAKANSVVGGHGALALEAQDPF